MKSSLVLQNRQRVRRVNLRYLRRIVRSFLDEQLAGQPYDLGICLVEQSTITRLNETYLGHTGATDIITFDYREASNDGIIGELFISVPQAVEQAARFRTSWQSELVRYIVHGVLHLCGYDDRVPRMRTRMKRQEHRWLLRLHQRFAFDLLSGDKSQC